MILPDLNLLLYAYNSQVPQHSKARAWWEDRLNGSELVGLPQEVTLGFVRIATNQRLGAAAVSLSVASGIVDTWMAASPVRVLLPLETHARKVFALMSAAGVSGQLTSDASLAVYAMESRATLCSNDADFARFPGLKWKNPLVFT